MQVHVIGGEGTLNNMGAAITKTRGLIDPSLRQVSSNLTLSINASNPECANSDSQASGLTKTSAHHRNSVLVADMQALIKKCAANELSYNDISLCYSN